MRLASVIFLIGRWGLTTTGRHRLSAKGVVVMSDTERDPLSLQELKADFNEEFISCLKVYALLLLRSTTERRTVLALSLSDNDGLSGH